MSSLSFISFLILMINSKAVVEQCPERCLCHEGLIDCRRQLLFAVPRHLPANTTVLDLRNNRLMKISRSDFKNLAKLELLLISWNQIHTFEEGTLDRNLKLRKLLLAGNRLKSIPKFSSHHLTNLQHIDLSINNIGFMEQQPLWNVPNLQVLNLADNVIQTLSQHFFDYSKKLKTLILSGNPLNCDCRYRLLHFCLIEIN